MRTTRLPNQPYALPVSLDVLVNEPLRLVDKAADLSAAQQQHISDLARAAAQLYETVTRQAVMEAQYVSVVDAWSAEIHGLVGPVRAVSRVAYRDGANITADLLPEDYELSDLYADRLVFPNYTQLPRVYPHSAERIRIYYTAGAQTLAEVPPLTVQFIKLMVAHWYENPQAVVVAQNIGELPLGAREILNWEREPVL